MALNVEKVATCIESLLKRITALHIGLMDERRDEAWMSGHKEALYYCDGIEKEVLAAVAPGNIAVPVLPSTVNTDSREVALKEADRVAIRAAAIANNILSKAKISAMISSEQQQSCYAEMVGTIGTGGLRTCLESLRIIYRYLHPDAGEEGTIQTQGVPDWAVKLQKTCDEILLLIMK